MLKKKANKDELFAAVRAGDAQVVERCVKAGIDVNQSDSIGRTPLFLAATAGDLLVVEVLLKANVDINQTKRGAATPLVIAVQQGHLAVVKALLSAGWGKSQLIAALEIAQCKKYYAVVSVLEMHLGALRIGINKMKTQNYGLGVLVSGAKRLRLWNTYGPYSATTEHTYYEPLLDYLNQRKNGNDEDNPSSKFPQDGKYSWTEEGCTKNEIILGYRRVRYDEGPGDRAWMEEKDRNYLARLQREEEARSHEAKADHCCETEAQRHKEEYQDRREVEAPPPPPSNLTETKPMPTSNPASVPQPSKHHHALPTSSSSTPAIQRSHTNPPPPSTQIDLNQTLYEAASRGDITALEQALQSGANTHYADTKGVSSLMIASQNGHVAIVERLVDKGAPLEAKTVNNQKTALWLAAGNGYVAVVRVLLAHGANPNTQSRDGTTALKAAEEGGHTTIVQLLRAAIERAPQPKKPAQYADTPYHKQPMHAGQYAATPARLSAPTVSPVASRGRHSDAGSQRGLESDTRNVIPASDLAQQKKIGDGAYGVVYQGLWRGTTSVAIKQLKLTNLPAAMLAEFEQETGIMAALRHPHIVQFYGVCIESPYRIVMEYCSKGSLYSVLHNQQPLTWKQRYQWGKEIGQGLDYLHSKDILHRDLKSLNVLLTKLDEVKLTDFGLAKVKSHVSSMTAQKTLASSVGTLAWMAPELSDMKPVYSSASDVYAYGVVLWELASREAPFKDAANPMLIPMWVQQGQRPKIPPDCPPKWATLIGQCWAQRADARPQALQVVKALEEQAPPVSQVVTRNRDTMVASHQHLETKGYQSQASQGYR